MITIQEALAVINSQSVQKSKLNLPVIESLGYYLAENIASSMDLPPFDNSAMDGYAVCGSGDHFRVIGEVAAGEFTSRHLAQGEAMRIFTGAKIPENSTAVIMQEKTEVTGDQLKLTAGVVEGKNIRKRGEEIARGQIVFEVGQKINPATVGLLSSLGLKTVPVYQKPTVSILTTGNELVLPGNPLQTGQIYESNGSALLSVLKQFDIRSNGIRYECDDYQRIRMSVAKGFEQSNVLLISGGISVGAYDFVKRALEENGVEELFYKVKQKPGKPLYFGRKEEKFVFALPGNPASALTCFYMYVLPLLQRIAGAVHPGLLTFDAPLAKDYPMKSDRPSFMKAFFRGDIEILEGQSSSMLHSFAMGNALAFIDGPRTYRKGELVRCFLLE